MDSLKDSSTSRFFAPGDFRPGVILAWLLLTVAGLSFISLLMSGTYMVPFADSLDTITCTCLVLGILVSSLSRADSSPFLVSCKKVRNQSG